MSGLLLFLTKIGARRQMRFQFRTRCFVANVNSLLGTSCKAMLHPDTLAYLAKRLEVSTLEDHRRSLLYDLLRKKVFEKYRLLNKYYLVAIDGTGHLVYPQRHCPHCLTQDHGGVVTYYHPVLEAKLVTANGLAFGGSADAGGVGVPGMDQVTPVLPDHPVSPGDTWEKRFSQKFPFGKGAIEYTARSTFDRYEDVDGSRTAVITTRYAMPIDLTVDLGELFEAFGDSLGATPTEPSDLADAKMIYAGSGSFAMTSWFDLATRELVKSSSSGDFDMTIRVTGFPDVPGFPAEFSFGGTFTQELERI
jgi:hypothetical protein